MFSTCNVVTCPRLFDTANYVYNRGGVKGSDKLGLGVDLERHIPMSREQPCSNLDFPYLERRHPIARARLILLTNYVQSRKEKGARAT